jgi:hypothetical protein
MHPLAHTVRVPPSAEATRSIVVRAVHTATRHPVTSHLLSGGESDRRDRARMDGPKNERLDGKTAAT